MSKEHDACWEQALLKLLCREHLLAVDSVDAVHQSARLVNLNAIKAALRISKPGLYG